MCIFVSDSTMDSPNCLVEHVIQSQAKVGMCHLGHVGLGVGVSLSGQLKLINTIPGLLLILLGNIFLLSSLVDPVDRTYA